jgi:hypothetical protein
MSTTGITRVNRPSSYPQTFSRNSPSSDPRPAAVQLIKSAIEHIGPGTDGVGANVDTYA